MTDFSFPVDATYARNHNEFFRDAKRLQISAGVLAVILLAIAAVLAFVLHPSILTIGGAFSLGFFALLCLIMIPVLPRTMGDPQSYYDTYALAPAVVAKVNPRDLVLLSLVDASTSPEARSNGALVKPALAARTVTSIPGVPREVGARVPSMAVTGVERIRNRQVYEQISPMPVAWGTPDESVWREAERAIPRNQWKRLEQLIDRVDEVRKTPRDLLLLEEDKK